MIMEFHRPGTVEEAVRLKEKWAEGAFFLGGGTQINSCEFPFSPQHLISLEKLGLHLVVATESQWVIGACCTVQELIESPNVPECLKAAASGIVNRNIRNMATIGGQLCGASSRGELVPLLVALDASVEVRTREGLESVPALDYASTSERQALVTRIRIPRNDPPRSVGMERYARMSNDLPVLAAAVTLATEGNNVRSPIIALSGATQRVVRLEVIENQLEGAPLPAREQLEGWVSEAVSPAGDFRGSAAFKKHLAGVIVAGAVYKAFRGEGGRVA